MKYQNVYQHLIYPESHELLVEEWKAFNNDCLKTISFYFRRLKIPREDLASNHSILEDAYCHLLEVVHKKIHTYNPEVATFKTWINGYIKLIVLQFSNRIYPFDIEIARSEIYHSHETDLFDIMLKTRKSDQPDELLLFKEAEASLQLALNKLPGNWYRVLYYRCFQGYTIEETAKRMNTTKERVSNMLNKARGRLKSNLEKMEWDIKK